MLDGELNVIDGGLLLTPNLPVIGGGCTDNTDGYPPVRQLATNVEAVSSCLMAMPMSVYQQVGGLPIFAYGAAAGIAYGLRLRRNDYRVVYNPWSKIVSTAVSQRPPDLAERL